MKQGIIPSVSHDASAVSSSLSSTTTTTTTNMPVNHPAVATATATASSTTTVGGGVPLGTYEATMAALSQQQQPDPIHWMNHVTFREHRYRLLHHQCGTIGIFTVRLLQARHLRRSYWSPLALGPVKLLGFSKAHGPVSSFCEFTLDFVDPSYTSTADGQQQQPRVRGDSNRSHTAGGGDRKPAARNNTKNNTTTNNTSSSGPPMIVSPVVPNNDHPVWGDTCHFEFPLSKGAALEDGMRIMLNVMVREDATTVEQMIPGMNQILHSHRLLGMGQIDLTDLCRGENIITGQPLPGVRDAWIDLTLPRQDHDDNDDDDNYKDNSNSSKNETTMKSLNNSIEQQETDQKPAARNASSDVSEPQTNNSSSNNSNNNNTNYGQVRVLVSYQPVGLEPQVKDIVAFESFARHSVHSMSCPVVMDPLLPLTVLDRRGSYLLVEYILASPHRQRQQEKVCVRVHRNAVFVIERQNIVDAATNLALLPMDVALSTPIGRATQRAVTPLVIAGSEVLMPALLSAKLVWMAVRTTGLGVTHGLLALTGTLWHEGTTSLTGGGGGGNGSNSNSSNSSNNHSHHRGNIHHQHRSKRSNATAKFVQL